MVHSFYIHNVRHELSTPYMWHLCFVMSGYPALLCVYIKNILTSQCNGDCTALGTFHKEEYSMLR